MTLIVACSARAQDTELQSCLPDARTCSESPGQLLERSCGTPFYFYRGRLSWPALRAVGPIVIAVKVKENYDTLMPLYVEIVTDVQSPDCATGILQFPVLVTHGSTECGGVWLSIGPLDITRFAQVGTLYRVQVEAFDNGEVTSIGLACIQVTTPTAVNPATWGMVKQLYRDASP